MSYRSFSLTRNGTLALCGLSLLSVLSVGCSQGNESDSSADSQVMWMQDSKTDDASVKKAQSSKLAVQINLQSNRATLFKDGQAVSQWNIASADVTGEFHDKIPQSTPTGIFAVEDMQLCPTWLPRTPVDPKTGKKATNEQERMAIIKNNPDLFGPCGVKNPLGSYVIWFHGEYGIHGNAAEWILEIADAEQRRVSGGCIRNPNRKIKELFHLVIDTFSDLTGFKKSVTDMEAAQAKDKKTITQSLSNTDMKVIVGRWSKDPVVGAVAPKNDSAPAPVVTPAPAQPKMKCVVSSVDPNRGIVPVYFQLPAKFDNEHTFYSRGDSATVSESVAGTNLVKVEKGFIDKKYLSNCQIQN